MARRRRTFDWPYKVNRHAVLLNAATNDTRDVAQTPFNLLPLNNIPN